MLSSTPTTFALIAEIVDQKPFRPFIVTARMGVAYREHRLSPPSTSEILIYDSRLRVRVVDVGHVVWVEPERERSCKR